MSPMNRNERQSDEKDCKKRVPPIGFTIKTYGNPKVKASPSSSSSPDPRFQGPELACRSAVNAMATTRSEATHKALFFKKGCDFG